MHRLPLAFLLVLAACAETRESCEADVTREIRRLDDLIVDTRRDLARGYTYERYTRPGLRGPFVGGGLTICSGGNDVSLCTATGTWNETARRRVAVDPAAEQRKLDYLEARRIRLAQEGEAACAAGHPEG